MLRTLSLLLDLAVAAVTGERRTRAGGRRGAVSGEPATPGRPYVAR